MALSFNGSSSKLEISTDPIITAYPCAIFCWIKPTSAGTSEMVLGSGDASGATDEFDIYKNGGGSGKVVAFSNAGGSSAGSPDSTTSISTSWTPAMAVFTSSVSRTIYYGAGASVNDTTSIPITFGLLDRFVIGTRAKADSLWFTGDIAEVAIWQTTVPGASEWTTLSGGVAPETVMNGSLKDSWSLLTQASTQVGTVSRTLTASNTTQAATHPFVRGGSSRLFRTNPSGNLSGLGSSGPFFQNPLQ